MFTIVSIPIDADGSTTSIQSWMEENLDKTIRHVLAKGAYWYIFYE